jgi:perosamine synthetase
MKYKIFVNKPSLHGNERKYLNEAFDSSFISSSGNFINKFEYKFSKKVNRKYAVSVCNGTVALQIAMEALGIKKGDEVILPSFTIISCILPIIRIGAIPVLIDCNLDTWNLNINSIKKKITKKTKLIVAPHIYGLPVEMGPLLDLAKKNRIKVLEDAAEALGLKYNNKPCGSFGDISTFSFYINKHITTGEGGMIVTDNKFLYKKCLSLKNLYFNDKKRFFHYGLGWNSRFTNLQAAIGLAQLEKLDLTILKKKKIGSIYYKELKEIPNIQLPVSYLKYSENIYWVFGILLKNDNKRLTVNKIRNELKKKGIETRNFFWPLHKQPVFKKMGLFKNLNLPVSEYLGKNGFYLPSGVGLKETEQNYVINTLKNIIING